MKRIILHWTAGKYKPNRCDLEHYHFLIDGNGIVHNGKFPVSANENCKDGLYAQHTGGGNTDSIGIAMCAMLGYKNSTQIGNYPITAVQFERTMQLCAQLLQKYNLPLSSKTMMTHFEFGFKNPKTSSFGKIDVTFIPSYPHIRGNEVGEFIRSKVRWYMENL